MTEIQYPLIFKALPQPLLLLSSDNPHFTIISANSAFLQAFGIQETELVDKTIFQAFNGMAPGDGAFSQNLQHSLSAVISSHMPHTMPVQKFHKDSTAVKYWKPENIPVLNDDGNITAIIHSAVDVTDKFWREQDELAVHDNQLSLMYNAVTDIIYMLSIEQNNRFKFISVNHAFLEASGLTAEMVVGKYADSIIPPASWHITFVNYQKALKTKSKIQWEQTSVYPSGTKTDRISITPVLDNRGNCIRLVGSVHDITEQKEADEDIRFKAHLLNTIGQTVIATGLDGIILYWNSAAEKMFGWTADEAIGKNALTLISAHIKMEQQHEIIGTLAQGLTWSGELVMQRKDGQLFTIFTTNSPILGPGNTLSGIIGVSSDISERKKAGEEIKHLANKLLLATSSAGIGVWDWNITNGHLTWDEGMYLLYNTNRLQFDSVYDGWLSMLHPDDKYRVNEDIQMAITGEKKYNTEFRIISDANLVHHIKANGIVEFDDKGKAVRMIGVNWDITERRLSEIRLKELNENLQKHTKELAVSNAELEQFAYVASHDLQEPLRMVTSFLTRLEKKYAPVLDDKGRKYIDFAVDGAKRMRQIILDLLEFSRVGRIEASQEQLNLNELMVEIQKLLRKKITEKHAVIVVDDLSIVHAYRSPVRQVFQNLIDNALKYSKPDIPPIIHVSVKDRDDHWEFAIKDNGVGINKEYFDKIFIIFQRLHNHAEYSGTGMGLSITKKIIENQGGRIWVESEEGNGSTFYFTLLKQH